MGQDCVRSLCLRLASSTAQFSHVTASASPDTHNCPAGTVARLPVQVAFPPCWASLRGSPTHPSPSTPLDLVHFLTPPCCAPRSAPS